MITALILLTLAQTRPHARPVEDDEAVLDAAKEPAARHRAISILMCAQQAIHDEAQRTIADEKENARLTGMVDRETLYEAGYDVVASTKKLKWAKAALGKTRPTPCASPEIVADVECLSLEDQCEGHEAARLDIERLKRLLTYLGCP